ncbi:MAG: DNA polymerase III subunit gamma/tau [bacterium]|nr:DNA polymerase III subunit gamma/tau [bacterium]
MSENYIPLYRKYRPQNLKEIVGQEHIKHALSSAIELNKFSHAYLFTGPRGTGKTSTARILAKSLNCQEGPTLTPCEKCPSCLNIKNSNPIDVIELDAASNRSVEDAQNILEKVQYAPVNGKFKIYIIDEVHMLTTHAFNALLKTLEEPPKNVIFILATTEPHKVLETIISRCQRFDFRRITTQDIVNHLKYVSEQEKINIEEDALFTIAKNASGGMRDSLSLLDQLSVLNGSKAITTEDVNSLLGRLSFDTLKQLTDFIVNSDAEGGIEYIEKIYNNGNEPTQILTNLLAYLKNLLIIKNCQKEDLLLDLTLLSKPQIDDIKTQIKNLETHQITFLIERTSYYIKEVKNTTNQHLWLEIAIIDLANLTQNTTLADLQERITKLEMGEVAELPQHTYNVSAPKVSAPKPQPEKIETKPEINKEIKEETKEEVVATNNIEEAKEETMPLSKVSKPANNDLKELWISLLQNISSSSAVALLSQHTKPVEISEENIIISCKEIFFKILSSESKKAAIEEGARKLFNKPVKVEIQTSSAQDFAEEKKNITVKPAKSSPKPVQSEEEKNEENFDENEYIDYEIAKSQAPTNSAQSDQVSMVMKLFNGKMMG